jgi:hypothetical protein
MSGSYTYEELEQYTLIELREMCRDNEIPGMSKARKDDVIDALLDFYSASDEESKIPDPGPVVGGAKGVSGTFFTTLTDPNAPEGQKTSTTVRVSCGAASDFFNVAGKTVSEVSVLLKDAFNISSLTTGLINGKEVKGSYILKSGDNLEFLKPAGDKG